ncbi:hypothetical protein B0H15DRAFT_807335 [Mycena belliarum]|uniref:Uncharacterized protein n=1 Tax=Mycena belliarum TaxID=1033014 RepID=A0AAD6XHY9_9AGAR|nr:hypothetical protein B0H15DRAFT_807335 [Mycena belliae]
MTYSPPGARAESAVEQAFQGSTRHSPRLLRGRGRSSRIRARPLSQGIHQLTRLREQCTLGELHPGQIRLIALIMSIREFVLGGEHAATRRSDTTNNGVAIASSTSELAPQYSLRTAIAAMSGERDGVAAVAAALAGSTAPKTKSRVQERRMKPKSLAHSESQASGRRAKATINGEESSTEELVSAVDFSENAGFEANEGGDARGGLRLIGEEPVRTSERELCGERERKARRSRTPGLESGALAALSLPERGLVGTSTTQVIATPSPDSSVLGESLRSVLGNWQRLSSWSRLRGSDGGEESPKGELNSAAEVAPQCATAWRSRAQWHGGSGGVDGDDEDLRDAAKGRRDGGVLFRAAWARQSLLLDGAVDLQARAKAIHNGRELGGPRASAGKPSGSGARTSRACAHERDEEHEGEEGEGGDSQAAGKHEGVVAVAATSLTAREKRRECLGMPSAASGPTERASGRGRAARARRAACLQERGGLLVLRAPPTTRTPSAASGSAERVPSALANEGVAGRRARGARAQGRRGGGGAHEDGTCIRRRLRLLASALIPDLVRDVDVSTTVASVVAVAATSLTAWERRREHRARCPDLWTGFRTAAACMGARTRSARTSQADAREQGDGEEHEGEEGVRARRRRGVSERRTRLCRCTCTTTEPRRLRGTKAARGFGLPARRAIYVAWNAERTRKACATPLMRARTELAKNASRGSHGCCCHVDDGVREATETPCATSGSPARIPYSGSLDGSEDEARRKHEDETHEGDVRGRRARRAREQVASSPRIQHIGQQRVSALLQRSLDLQESSDERLGCVCVQENRSATAAREGRCCHRRTRERPQLNAVGLLGLWIASAQNPVAASSCRGDCMRETDWHGGGEQLDGHEGSDEGERGRGRATMKMSINSILGATSVAAVVATSLTAWETGCQLPHILKLRATTLLDLLLTEDTMPSSPIRAARAGVVGVQNDSGLKNARYLSREAGVEERQRCIYYKGDTRPSSRYMAELKNCITPTTNPELTHSELTLRDTAKKGRKKPLARQEGHARGRRSRNEGMPIHEEEGDRQGGCRRAPGKEGKEGEGATGRLEPESFGREASHRIWRGTARERIEQAREAERGPMAAGCNPVARDGLTRHRGAGNLDRIYYVMYDARYTGVTLRSRRLPAVIGAVDPALQASRLAHSCASSLQSLASMVLFGSDVVRC